MLIWVKRHIWLVVALFVCLCAYVLPILVSKASANDDIWYHMFRITNIAEELKAGQFPVRFFGADPSMPLYGNFSPLVYGDWLLYLPAGLMALGASQVVIWKVTLIMVAVLASVCGYVSGKTIFGSKKAGAFFSVLLLLQPYFYDNLILRSAIGEAIGYAFIPLAFAGLFNILVGDRKRWWLLPLGVSAIIVSHNISVILCLCFLVAFVVFGINYFFKDFWAKARLILLSVGVVLLVTASYWVPFVEQVAFMGDSAFKSIGSINPPWCIWNIPETFLTVSNDPNHKAIGTAVLFILLFIIIGFRKTEKKKLLVPFLGFVALFTILAYKPIVEMKFYQIFASVQFPYRFILLVSIGVALLGGFVFAHYRGSRVIHIIGCSVIMIATVFSFSLAIKQHSYSRYGDLEKDDYRTFAYLKNAGALFNMNGGNKEVSSFEGFNKAEIEGRKGEIRVSNRGVSAYIDVPMVMAKGVAAEMNGERLEVGYSDKKFVRVYVGDKGQGEIRVWYKGTVLQVVSFWVSVLSIIGILVWFIRKRREKDEEIIDNSALL